MTPWAVAHQSPLSMEFPVKNTGVGWHFLLQGIFLIPGIESTSPLLTGRFLTTVPLESPFFLYGSPLTSSYSPPLYQLFNGPWTVAHQVTHPTISNMAVLIYILTVTGENSTLQLHFYRRSQTFKSLPTLMIRKTYSLLVLLI